MNDAVTHADLKNYVTHSEAKEDRHEQANLFTSALNKLGEDIKEGNKILVQKIDKIDDKVNEIAKEDSSQTTNMENFSIRLEELIKSISDINKGLEKKVSWPLFMWIIGGVTTAVIGALYIIWLRLDAVTITLATFQ